MRNPEKFLDRLDRVSVAGESFTVPGMLRSPSSNVSPLRYVEMLDHVG